MLRVLLALAVTFAALAQPPPPQPMFVRNDALAQMSDAGWHFRVVPSDLKGRRWRCQAAPPGMEFPSQGREGVYSFWPKDDGCHAEDTNGGVPVR